MSATGLREITIADADLGLTFPAVVQYPAAHAGPDTQMGPYTFASTRDAAPAEGRFPLVIISHGGGGSHLLYRTIATHLAANGFVVVAPEHAGNNRRENTLQHSNENVVRRVNHLSLTIDALLTDPLLGAHVDAAAVAAIGHSIGGTAVLAMAGGVPWSRDRLPIAVKHDTRLCAAVLLAPATEWYQAPDSLSGVQIPLLIYAGRLDTMTPVWQAELVVRAMEASKPATLVLVEGAGHYAFLSPFPAAMQTPAFVPAQDPPGFDREQFHRRMAPEIAEFLRAHLNDSRA
jgi:predicted dienelactone hydrolase